MRCEVRLSRRAAKDIDNLSGDARERILHRLDQLGGDPFDPRLSRQLTSKGGLRKSRVGGWRIIFTVEEGERILDVVTVERRGQVYHRV